MNKAQLLKLIAESAYNIGFGAKRNFATFDIVEKGPGWLSFISLVVGVYALFVPELTTSHVGAIMVVFGVVTLYISFYQQDKGKYERAGVELTRYFHELRMLYYEVNSMTDSADITSQVAAHKALYDQFLNVTVSKQIFMSDWYAHFKFFWQQQIEWIDEQKQFGLLRDKVPLSFSVVFLTIVVFLGWLASRHSIASLCQQLA